MHTRKNRNHKVTKFAAFVHVVCGTVYKILSQNVCRVCKWKNCENRSIIGKDMGKSKVPRFLWPTVYCFCSSNIVSWYDLQGKN